MQLIKRRGTLVVVSAPSGAGKTTLCHEVRTLVPDLYYSVSYTTRAPRHGETNGTDFFFVTEGAFTAMRARDEFAEWAEVHGHLYGTPAKALESAARPRARRAARHRHPRGRQLRQRYPEAVRCSSWPRRWPSWRLGCASATATPPATSRRRLSRAKEEIAAWRQYDYLIINRDVKEAVDQLATIIQAERCRTSRLTLRFPDMEVPA